MCDAGNIKMGGWDYTFVFSWKIKTIKNKQWTWTTYIYIHLYIYIHIWLTLCLSACLIIYQSIWLINGSPSWK
jgi:hypothetical protein